MTYSNDPKVFSDILSSPTSVVPSLSAGEIKTILIETILAYLEKRKINLKTLAKVAELIKQYHICSLPHDLKNDLEEISLMYAYEEVLVEILDVLVKE